MKEEFIRIQGFICYFAEEYPLNKIVRYYSESPTVKWTRRMGLPYEKIRDVRFA